MICCYCNDIITKSEIDNKQYVFKKEYVKNGSSKIRSKFYFHCRCYKEKNKNDINN